MLRIIAILIVLCSADVASARLFHGACINDVAILDYKNIVTNGINAQDAAGNTPLMLAAEAGADDFAEKLIDLGADINIKNNSGVTALHNAVIHGNAEIVSMLISNGADQNITNRYGTTALELVKRQGYSSFGEFVDVMRILDSRSIGVSCKLHLDKWEWNLLQAQRSNNGALEADLIVGAAKLKNPRALYLLSLYQHEKGDTEGSYRYAMEAARLGDIDAMRYIAKESFANGADQRYGAEFVCQLAAMGSTNDMAACGKLLYEGEVIDEDLQLAYVYLMSAKDYGDANSAYYLGLMRYYGKGVPLNSEQGLNDIRSAASMGSAEAQHFLRILVGKEVLSTISAGGARDEAQNLMKGVGAMLANADEHCDYYKSGIIFLDDFNIKDISVCYSNSGAPKVTATLNDRARKLDESLFSGYGKNFIVQ